MYACIYLRIFHAYAYLKEQMSNLCIYVRTYVHVCSLGISMLEVSCDLELPGYGPQWHQLREERLPEEFTQYLSPSLKTIISSMLTSRPQHRPSAQDLLESQIVANVSILYVCTYVHTYVCIVTHI